MRFVLGVAALAAVVALSGCGPASGSSMTAGTSVSDLRVVAVNGHVTGTAPASCREGRASGGQPLPDSSCTPGSVSGAGVATICRSGYTSTVRPPEGETEAFKRKIMKAYGEVGSLADYELDHLVPLELGGSNDASNLWPERDDNPKPGVINSKDLVENSLHRAVCAGQLDLATAQVAIARDWTTASRLIGGSS